MSLFASSLSTHRLTDEVFCLDAGAGGITRLFPVCALLAQRPVSEHELAEIACALRERVERSADRLYR